MRRDPRWFNIYDRSDRETVRAAWQAEFEAAVLELIDRIESYPESWRTDEVLVAKVARVRTLLGMPEKA